MTAKRALRSSALIAGISLLTSSVLLAAEGDPPETPPAETPPAETAPAAAPKALAPSPPLPPRETLASEALSARVPDNEIRWIDDSQGRFLSLLREQFSGQALGLTILLPAPGKTAANPQAIDLLRHQLNDHGWVTLAMAPPEPVPMPAHVSPLTVTADAAQPDATGQQDPSTGNGYQPPYPADKQGELDDAFAERLAERLSAAIKLKEIYPGITVIIAQGSNADWLIELLSAEQLPAPDALVLLNARPRLGRDEQQLAEQLAQLPLPILDLYQRHNNLDDDGVMTLRAQLRRKHQQGRYRQRQLFGASADQRLTKIVYGWLSANGWRQ